MNRYKFDEKNNLWYELGDNGVYYPMLNFEKELNVGKYGKLAMEHMKASYPSKYEALEALLLFPTIFNDIDDKVHNMIDNIMDKKLKEEPIQENWNVLEIEKHKKMLYREIEELVLKEIVYINHFKNVEFNI